VIAPKIHSKAHAITLVKYDVCEQNTSKTVVNYDTSLKALPKRGPKIVQKRLQKGSSKGRGLQASNTSKTLGKTPLFMNLFRAGTGSA